MARYAVAGARSDDPFFVWCSSTPHKTQHGIILSPALTEPAGFFIEKALSGLGRIISPCFSPVLLLVCVVIAWIDVWLTCCLLREGERERGSGMVEMAVTHAGS